MSEVTFEKGETLFKEQGAMSIQIQCLLIFIQIRMSDRPKG